MCACSYSSLKMSKSNRNMPHHVFPVGTNLADLWLLFNSCILGTTESWRTWRSPACSLWQECARTKTRPGKYTHACVYIGIMQKLRYNSLAPLTCKLVSWAVSNSNYFPFSSSLQELSSNMLEVFIWLHLVVTCINTAQSSSQMK